MPSQYREITDHTLLDNQQWNNFVLTHPNGNVFQSPQFYLAVSATKKYQPLLVAITDNDGVILGLMVAMIQAEHSWPLNIFSARSIIHGGPLLRVDDAEILKILLEEYTKIIKLKAIYTQFRNLKQIDYYRPFFIDKGYNFEDHLNILVDLSKSEEQLWKEIESKRRNEIRRATKEGTIFREITSEFEFKISYDILFGVYSRVKIPLPSYDVFWILYSILQVDKIMRCFVAEWNGKIIGTMIVFCYRDTIFDWYAGAYKEYYDKYPNDLIPWEVFKWGKKNGFKIFDFGGAGKPNEKYSVRDYKKKFGGKLVNFGRFICIHKPLLWRYGNMAYSIYKLFR